jgi:hypothetical protein
MLYYNKNNLINAFKALDRTQFHDWASSVIAHYSSF